MKHRLLKTVFLLLCSLPLLSGAQEIKRPEIWGIAKMTFLVSNFELARDYYGRFLGFDEAFSYESELGTVLSFKVNDRQFLEFIEDEEAKNKSRLVSVSFETEETKQMMMYLQNKNVNVSENVKIDGAGNETILVYDFSGVPIEFITFSENSLHRKSKGRFLSENRISKRIHHVGLYCREVVDDDPFYAGILGFKEIWRYPENNEEKVIMNYYQIPDCVENIEHYPSNDINFSHPCFLVDDMQETIYTLKERRGNNKLAKPMVGKGKRWLLNIQNEDGTKVEFTEAHAIR
jgi:catechol 2,3-dioxygenase-like lactoylglutathione lyase family enzyme